MTNRLKIYYTSCGSSGYSDRQQQLWSSCWQEGCFISPPLGMVRIRRYSHTFPSDTFADSRVDLIKRTEYISLRRMSPSTTLVVFESSAGQLYSSWKGGQWKALIEIQLAPLKSGRGPTSNWDRKETIICSVHWGIINNQRLDDIQPYPTISC